MGKEKIVENIALFGLLEKGSMVLSLILLISLFFPERLTETFSFFTINYVFIIFLIFIIISVVGHLTRCDYREKYYKNYRNESSKNIFWISLIVIIVLFLTPFIILKGFLIFDSLKFVALVIFLVIMGAISSNKIYENL